MKYIVYKEAAYLRKHFNNVKHLTLNPNGPGALRIHMVPPKFSLKKDIPSLIIVNGQDIVPLNFSWAVLLSAFIDRMLPFDGAEMSESDLRQVIDSAIREVRKIYPKTPEQVLKDDLMIIISTLTDIAGGRKPEADIGLIALGEYAGNMRAPHRMDLMISAMSKDGRWNCNQQCLHCYAAEQKLAEAKELSSEQWKNIIHKCREEGIPQLTFTGGEPTLRQDLIELINYSRWFVTRLNTNGVLLTKGLCKQLADASLDSVQITLYSSDPLKHNELVGACNWEKTVEGIKIALEAGINTSINTPLCKINSDYTETLQFVNGLGVKYVTCSGLILTGNANKDRSAGTRLNSEELLDILKSAFIYCADNGMEVSFTSPGWIEETKLREIGFTAVPSCGACLSNMAVTPDGHVAPCQSWLSVTPLGNMLTDPWKKIWNNPRCKAIRNESAKMRHICPLHSGDKEGVNL